MKQLKLDLNADFTNFQLVCYVSGFGKYMKMNSFDTTNITLSVSVFVPWFVPSLFWHNILGLLV